MRAADLGGAGEWHRWSEELDDGTDGVSFPLSVSLYVNSRMQTPNFFCSMDSENDWTRLTKPRFTPARRYTYRIFCASLGPPHSRCTSTCSAAGAYSCIRNLL